MGVMAVHQRTHPSPASPGELAARLRELGLRVTPQREQVLDAVRSLGHATPEQICESIEGVDVTTVYRTLDLLEQIGLVRHAHLGHGAPSYRPAAVVDADPSLVEPLAEHLLADDGFVLDRSHFTVFGRCRNCAAEQMPPTKRSGLHDDD